MYHTYNVCFLITFLTFLTTTNACSKANIDTTQACFSDLTFPKDGSDKETICKYVEAGMLCFEPACCVDERYTVAVKQIQAQAEAVGCASLACGLGNMKSLSLPLMILPAFLLVLFLQED